MNAFVRYTVMGIYKLFYNFRIEGWENVPEKRALSLLPTTEATPTLLSSPCR